MEAADPAAAAGRKGELVTGPAAGVPPCQPVLVSRVAQLRAQQAHAAVVDGKRKKRELLSVEKAAVDAGKKPFYLKKQDKRKLELIDKFSELKESGKLERALAKKRRKNAQKDHRFAPMARE